MNMNYGTTKRFGSRQVEAWIDGATIRTNEGGHGTTVGFAWNLYDQVFEVFTVLVPLVSKGRSSAQSTKHEKSLKDSLGKLFLWGMDFAMAGSRIRSRRPTTSRRLSSKLWWPWGRP
jgi:hypothetical protein